MSGSVSSSLSELGEDGIDTEAETERLEISPQKPLSVSNKELPNADSDSSSGATSPVAGIFDAEVGNSVLGDNEEDDSDQEATPSPLKVSPPPPLAGNKRKRRSSLSSNIGLEPARKRSGSSRIDSTKRGDNKREKEATTRDTDVIEESNEYEDPTITEENNTTSEVVIAEAGSKIDSADAQEEKKSGSSDDARSRSGTPAPDPDSRDEELIADADADADMGEIEDDEADAVAKSEDELARKRAALDALVPIEKNFKTLREKLYSEKIAELDAELESLTTTTPSHAELLGMLVALDHRRDEKIQHEQTLLYYKKEALERKIIGTRAQIHSQCFQELRQLKEDFLGELNRESSLRRVEMRRAEPRENHFIPRFNPRRTDQILHQTSYNKEVALLSGLATYRGFPAAPTIRGASTDEVAGDLRAMMVTARQPVYAQITQPPREADMALEKDFVSKTPWANPNHPAAQDAYRRERAASANRDVGLGGSKPWNLGAEPGSHIDKLPRQFSSSINHLQAATGTSLPATEGAAKLPGQGLHVQHRANTAPDTARSSDPPGRSPSIPHRNNVETKTTTRKMLNDSPILAKESHSLSSPGRLFDGASGPVVNTSQADLSESKPSFGQPRRDVAEGDQEVRDRFPYGRQPPFANGSAGARVGIEQIGGR